jgi:hypothetical protein
MTNLQKIKMVNELLNDRAPESKKYTFCLHVDCMFYSCWLKDEMENCAEFKILSDGIQTEIKGTLSNEVVADMLSELDTWFDNESPFAIRSDLIKK